MVLDCVGQWREGYLSGNHNALNSSSHQFAGLDQLLLAKGIVNSGREDLGAGNQCLCGQSGRLGGTDDLVLQCLVVALGGHVTGIADKSGCGAGNSLGHGNKRFLQSRANKLQVRTLHSNGTHDVVLLCMV